MPSRRLSCCRPASAGVCSRPGIAADPLTKTGPGPKSGVRPGRPGAARAVRLENVPPRLPGPPWDEVEGAVAGEGGEPRFATFPATAPSLLGQLALSIERHLFRIENLAGPYSAEEESLLQTFFV